VMGLIWPLVFAAKAEPTLFPSLTLDPTPTPIAAPDLQSVMDRDLHQALPEVRRGSAAEGLAVRDGPGSAPGTDNR
jgi:hypothetical protein